MSMASNFWSTTTFPNIHAEIFSYLTLKELGRFSQVSKTALELLNSVQWITLKQTPSFQGLWWGKAYSVLSGAGLKSHIDFIGGVDSVIQAIAVKGVHIAIASGKESDENTIQIGNFTEPGMPLHTLASWEAKNYICRKNKKPREVLRERVVIHPWELDECCQKYKTGIFFNDNTQVGDIKIHNNYLIAAIGSTLKVWDLSRERATECVASLESHVTRISCLATPLYENIVISGSERGRFIDGNKPKENRFDCSIKIWDLKTKKHALTIPGLEEVTCLAIREIANKSILEESVIVSGSRDCTVKIWKITNKKVILTKLTAGAGIRALGIVKDCLISARESDICISEMRRVENNESQWEIDKKSIQSSVIALDRGIIKQLTVLGDYLAVRVLEPRVIKEYVRLFDVRLKKFLNMKIHGEVQNGIQVIATQGDFLFCVYGSHLDIWNIHSIKNAQSEELYPNLNV